MRKSLAVPLTVVAFAAVLGIGFAVAAFGSPQQTVGTATGTSETTTTPTGTSEQPMILHYGAALSAKAEVPRPTGAKAGAGGTFTITVTHTASGYKATWKLTYRNLTGKAMAAHIHGARAGKAGPVLVPLCGPCTSGRSGKINKLPEMDVTALKKGKAYVNVHTAKNPNGEIRGQIAKR